MRSKRHVLYHTHPLSDGSVVGWEKLRAYTRNVGIPFGIAAELIANGNVNRWVLLRLKKLLKIHN